MGRPKATIIPSTENELLEKRLPLFVRWFESWKRARDTQLRTVAQRTRGRESKSGAGSVQKRDSGTCR